ncbi:polysaccharide deacetylase family protein [Gracilibacillus marinus]|uniref:Polysaccharide deacetylase family protein n=1 Tax=Gracilibacillus marinus TaxID=630535 RepID=A0ABV8VT77_9BACI
MLLDTIETNEKKIAFTFDDGPDPKFTEQILHLLEAANAKATFFMIGEHIKKFPSIAEKVYRNGHELANHTYSHCNLAEQDAQEVRTELLKAEECITSITGKKPASFRPPFFSYNENTLKIVEEFGYHTIGAANLDARDWDTPGVQIIYEESKKAIKNGAIFIFHDGLGDRSQTVEAVGKLIHTCIEQGYQLVTVEELLASTLK